MHTIKDKERDAPMFREGTEWARLHDALTEVDHLMKDGAARQETPEPEESLLACQLTEYGRLVGNPYSRR